MSPEPTESPSGSENPSASPTTTAEASAALKDALTKSAEANTASGTMHLSANGKIDARGTWARQNKPNVLTAKVSTLTLNGKPNSAQPQVIVSGDTAYVNGDGLIPNQGNTWWQVPLNNLPGERGKMISDLVTSGRLQDPATIKQISSAYKDIENEGQEQVGGQTVTHYSSTLDTQEAAQAAGLPIPSPSPANMPKTLRVDTWVDSTGMVKRQQFRNAEGGQPFNLNLTVKDYNKPVTVQTPPAGQVKEVDPQTLKNLLGE
ncbi:LppX_LprAFG lipoprotein [Herbidospora mongoliensis]|uniref:LppX_LprAFG lipoprotein n=1 Tax=Herbidospora mongoliensis TaxID=688067 RepID=UPI000834B794|nr:LppX_LprAFG lipoprotein [Herbidospora mongoliensis]